VNSGFCEKRLTGPAWSEFSFGFSLAAQTPRGVRSHAALPGPREVCGAAAAIFFLCRAGTLYVLFSLTRPDPEAPGFAGTRHHLKIVSKE